jgi:hypothetical protein
MTRVRDIATRSGLVQVIPTAVTVSSGSASVAANGAVTATAAVNLALDGVFTSSFTNYRLLFNGFSSANVGCGFVYRTPSGDFTSSLYSSQRLYSYSTTTLSTRGGSLANGLLADKGQDWGSEITDFFNPNTLNVYPTHITQGLYLSTAQAPEADFFTGACATGTQMTGIKFLASGAALTGSFRIYGYNNG